MPVSKLFLGLITVGDYVMAESKFGINLGVVLSTSWLSAQVAATVGKILRVATQEECVLFRKKLLVEEQAVDLCRHIIRSKGMDMALLDAEYDWRGEKVAFFFDAKK